MTTTFEWRLNAKLLTEDVLGATPLLQHLLALWAPAGTDTRKGDGRKRLQPRVQRGEDGVAGRGHLVSTFYESATFSAASFPA